MEILMLWFGLLSAVRCHSIHWFSWVTVSCLLSSFSISHSTNVRPRLHTIIHNGRCSKSELTRSCQFFGSDDELCYQNHRAFLRIVALLCLSAKTMAWRLLCLFLSTLYSLDWFLCIQPFTPRYARQVVKTDGVKRTLHYIILFYLLTLINRKSIPRRERGFINSTLSFHFYALEF